MDANEVLILTCQRLKEEAGKSPDFSYGDLAGFKDMQAGKVRKNGHQFVCFSTVHLSNPRENIPDSSMVRCTTVPLKSI